MNTNLNEILQKSIYFGAFLNIFSYGIGILIQKRFRKPFLNPLLIAIILVISILSFSDISYKTYQHGAQYLTYFLTPATVCLAIPLYKQLRLLKKHLHTILLSIFAGCISHLLSVTGFVLLFHMNRKFLLSFLPKSVTTPIALGICQESGGMEELTVVGVTIAGLIGAILGPFLLRLLRIRHPVAQGLALGTASHAIGTSKAVEIGEIQAAISSLSIVIGGILTVLLVPIYIRLFLS